MPSPVVRPEVADRLLAEILGRPEGYARLGELCDRIGGRPAGSPACARAEAWTRDLLAGWGLERPRFETFPITGWERGQLRAEVTAPQSWTMIALAHGNAPAETDLEAAVRHARHGERAQLEALGDATRGAILLVDEGASPGERQLHRSEKMLLAAEHGAAGLLIFSSADGGLPRTGTCHHEQAPIPSLGISQEDGLRLLRLLRDGASPRARIAMRNRFHPAEARNVLADIPGRKSPDEVVLAGAHLDSWDVAQGATDNGLGAAIVLEMARAMARLAEAGQRPRRTLRFALWSAEEIGLLGSYHHAAAQGAALDGYAAVMNFDMTGDPRGFWTPGRPEAPEALRALARQLSPLGLRRDGFAHRAALHSDHQPFWLEGVPVLGLDGHLEGRGGHYYHSVGDTFEKVSEPALCRAAAAAAHAMWLVADAPERLWPRAAPEQVRAWIEEAGLLEALRAEGYDGPPMRVEAG